MKATTLRLTGRLANIVVGGNIGFDPLQLLPPTNMQINGYISDILVKEIGGLLARLACVHTALAPQVPTATNVAYGGLKAPNCCGFVGMAPTTMALTRTSSLNGGAANFIACWCGGLCCRHVHMSCAGLQ